MTVHRIIPGMLSADLPALMAINEPKTVMEGWLTAHVMAGERIRLTVRVKDGEPVLGLFTSSPVISQHGNYVQGHRLVYHLVRIPPSRCGDNFAEFA
jgi:hypothetical protein